MSTPALPAPIGSLVDAVNDGDTPAFLAFFLADGVVDDWGRRFAGHDAIRGWSDREFIGAAGTMTVTNVAQQDDEVTVTADWVSDKFTGPSKFTFLLDGNRVREMRITGATRLSAVASAVLRLVRRRRHQH